MIELLQTWWPALLAYFIGATPFGFLAGKSKGIDIRDHGSGNIGATNVMRTLGKPVGTTVLILDVFKGMVPVLIVMWAEKGSAVVIATAVAAILGHNYTFWLGFKGGKGIATTGGALLPIMPIAILSAILLWILTVKATRYVSVASLVAAVTIPLVLLIRFLATSQWDYYTFGLGMFVCLLAIWKHRSNIARLRRGEENRVQPKSPTPTEAPPN
ncbi:MAG: glycerol-3-phosphate 1-O-acyltransferase PlsY [Verrucomicrobiales bacterium]|nr:glycerol-3-phosphate 1-O-acyltransferase PlsY [Verrucomicrobiales bacterium]